MFKASAVTEIATQAEQEAASSVAVAVSPGRQQYHPSAAKAWVRFNGTGTLAIGTSYNVSSVTDGGAGIYTPNYTTNFSNNVYAAVVSIGTQNETGRHVLVTATAVSSCTVQVSNLADNANVDSAIVSVVCYGDQ